MVFCRARYLTPGKDGETRAERNERFGAEVPEWDVPGGGQYLLDWFDDISNGVNRIGDGRVNRITWQDFIAWRDAMKTIVYPHEFAILKSMDMAYCEAMAGELEYASAVATEEAEKRRAGLSSKGRK